MTKIVFLDIDDVICTTRAHEASGGSLQKRALDPVAIAHLNEIHAAFPEIRYVVNSTWRLIMDFEEIFRRFHKAGFTGLFHDDWRTPDQVNETGKRFRGDAVNAWLALHPEISVYVCLDDDRDYYPDQPTSVRLSGKGSPNRFYEAMG